uniref:Protein kinase domain-containing protein n=1 Tax=Aegilops tauschii subsp. strangulata TaxID=200361 RepID=A0A453DKE0_AEGTS
MHCSCFRYNILVGIASGLEYLHNNCSRTVLHRDIKPANVMLDMDFTAKLCDFGLVTQLTRAATSRSTNNIIGTLGYMDPLYQQNGQVTKESDVYSFGVLLLEVLCGVAPILIGNPLKNSLIENVRECRGRNAILDAAHQRLRGEYDEEIKGALLIGLHCVETRRGDRPTIRIVLSNLVSLTASHVVMS